MYGCLWSSVSRLRRVFGLFAGVGLVFFCRLFRVSVLLVLSMEPPV